MAKPKLTKKERDALVAVRGMLASGQITHKRSVDNLPTSYREHFVIGLKRIFNMSVPARATECGSVGCIGGWMAAMMGKDINEADSFVSEANTGFDEWTGEDLPGNKFSDLFYPPERMNYEKINERQAVRAIDNFLKTGKPDWSKACRAR